MKKLVLSLFLLATLVLSSCATTQENATYQGAGVGAAIGAAAGAVIDNNNRWRGAAIGAAAGALFGATVTEISKRATEDAIRKNQTVRYKSGNTVVEASPMPSEKTNCHKVRKRVWENGKLVKDTIEEVCESEKTENRY